MAFTFYNPSNPYPQAPASRQPGPAPAPTNQSGLPNFAVLPYSQPGPRQPTNPTQDPLPDFRRPPSRPPGSYILRDSNPVKYPKPVGALQPRTGGNERPLLGGQAIASVGGASGAPANSGSILGSSVGNPDFYGAGLAPASGLGGGLYPSLVGLYR
jgi:hypothetical protein